MIRSQLMTRVLASALMAVFVIGCGKKVDEALLAEYNAKKGEAEKLIADATEGLKKLGDEHTSWMAKISEAAGSKAIDSAKAATLTENLRMHESMIPTVQAGLDSLKYYVAMKAETNDEVKAATAGLNAHLAAVGANWKALWEAHTKSGAEVMAALGAPAPGVDSSATTTTKTTTTTTTTQKHETVKKTPGGTPKVPPANVPPVDPTKHETAKKTPGGTPKTPPPSGGSK